MVSEPEARAAAAKALSALRDDLVITGVHEYDVGWVYFYQTAKYLETEHWVDLLGGNAPILVDRFDGSAHLTGTAEPLEEYIDRYRREGSANRRT